MLRYFNPRAPYGTRLLTRLHVVAAAQLISIHAPRTGRDGRRRLRWRMIYYFNPRAPYGTRHSGAVTRHYTAYFNPRAPYGTRLSTEFGAKTDPKFQSTRPVRDATCEGGGGGEGNEISIHAPRTGRDTLLMSLQ